MIRALNVFILAAGFGERLQPITHHIPKPLLPIAGRPVLEFILEKVITLPVNSIGINLHHKKKVIETWIKSSRFSKNIEIFPEESPLDTGGALKNAEEFLKESPFLVHNSDIMSDIDLAKLVDFHVTSKNFATLAVHDFPEFNSLSVDEQGFLREISMNQVQQDTGEKLAFTGIAVYDPDFFIFLKRGASSVVEAWKDAIAEGYGVKTLNVSGCYWRDIGTPSAYASAVFTALRDRGEIVYMHPSIEGCKHIEMNGYVVIENDCSLGEGVSLKNCIMLPKSTTEPSARHENCILGPGYSIDIEESEVVRLSEKDGRYLIGTGGSDRKYYRKERNGESVVVMQCLMDDTDFNNHIEYTRFFIEHSVPVPELKEIVPDTMSVVFEDLGDISLYSWLQCPREQGEIEEIYKKVLDILVLIHTRVTEHATECLPLQNRRFHYKHFRWESDYFIERFVKGIRNIVVKGPSVVHDDLNRIAERADSFPKTVIHRDYQSQNIMITKGRTPRIIDYQGARLGPPAYDVVSILWDPYYHLDDATREQLLRYYINEFNKRGGGFFHEDNFRETLLTCRLQRHMQALGAYGFLSAVKGKSSFLKFVPEGLKLLREDVSLTQGEYPGLYALVMGL